MKKLLLMFLVLVSVNVNAAPTLKEGHIYCHESRHLSLVGRSVFNDDEQMIKDLIVSDYCMIIPVNVVIDVWRKSGLIVEVIINGKSESITGYVFQDSIKW